MRKRKRIFILLPILLAFWVVLAVGQEASIFKKNEPVVENPPSANVPAPATNPANPLPPRAMRPEQPAAAPETGADIFRKPGQPAVIPNSQPGPRATPIQPGQPNQPSGLPNRGFTEIPMGTEPGQNPPQTEGADIFAPMPDNSPIARPMVPTDPLRRETATTPETEGQVEMAVEPNPGAASDAGEEPAPAENPEEVAQTEPETEEEPEEEEESEPARPRKKGPGFKVGTQTTKGARILTLSIPAPRGQIVDRYGEPLAQNVIAYYLGLNFPYMEKASDDDKIAYANDLVAKANEALGKEYSIKPRDILSHYKERRWLPLIFAKMPLVEEEVEKIRALDAQGLILHPTYQRFYPQGMTAGHIVGFVGKRGPWPKGEVPDGEAMWPTAEGIRGIEKWFDPQLKGSEGRVQIIFNEKGERVEETVIRDPVPGNNVVLSLDLGMQRLAEAKLTEGVKRGAMVVMDVQSGDVLAMASYPMFDPNDYIPRILQEKFSQYQNDPAKPLLGRAFQGIYPPASTFKVISALGCLESGTINEYNLYSCPTAYTLGNNTWHNWNEKGEGMMNVIGALARSCNTWFYQASLDSGAAHILSMGSKFGFGRKSGIELPEEVPGTMPTNEWSRKKYGHPVLKGDLLSISIGQGAVDSTPLQVAQAMAAVGNRQYLMEARLTLQLQDYANNIVDAYDVSRRNLNLHQHSLSVVHKGMWEVVNGARGTGPKAAHDRISISGKTGTGQWKPAIKQNVAWFAGFAPSEFPVYSYAVIYEGDPGEKVGGGSKAAPIIGSFFKDYLDDDKLAELKGLSDDIRVEMGQVIDIPPMSAGSIFKGGAAEAPRTDTAPPPAQKKRGGGLFKKLFGN